MEKLIARTKRNVGEILSVAKGGSTVEVMVRGVPVKAVPPTKSTLTEIKREPCFGGNF
jgi:hypothetical protein